MASETIKAPGGLEINAEHGEDSALVRLNGRLSIDSSPALRDCLLAMLRGEHLKVVIVDLTEAPYIDLSGIATLIEALKVARNCKTTLCLKGLHGPFLHLLEITGLSPLFEGADRASTQPVSGVN